MFWPRAVAGPIAFFAAWFAMGFFVHAWKLRRGDPET
jgi:hypothetical protein